MKFHIYQRKNKGLYSLTVISIGLVFYFGLLKLHLGVYAALAGSLYWIYLAANVLIDMEITIDPSNTSMTVRRHLGNFTLPTSEIPVSRFYGVRNRVHWGHYKHCQTELLERSGKYFPVRVELLSDKISQEAVDFKELVAQTTGLERRPDYGSA